MRLLVTVLCLFLCTACVRSDNYELLTKLQESRSLWDTRQISTYCFETEQNALPCDSTHTQFSVTDSAFSFMSTLVHQCDANCVTCSDAVSSSASAPASPSTIPEYYEECHNTIKSAAEDDECIVKLFGEDSAWVGVVQMCGCAPADCQDDCFEGVTIVDIADHSKDQDTSSCVYEEGASTDHHNIWWMLIPISVGVCLLIVAGVSAFFFIRRRRAQETRYDTLSTGSDFLLNEMDDEEDDGVGFSYAA